MRVMILAPLVLGLAACSSKVPDSGMSDYNSYVKGATPGQTSSTSGFSTDAAAAAINSAGITTSPSDAELFDPNRPRGDAPTNIKVESGEMVYATGALSDEQSFAAVTSRESIEGDAARIAANRAQYVVIEPTDIPQRPDNTGPDIVKYALVTTNPVGVQLYDRPSFYLVNVDAACLKYTSPDFAQQAFLAKGGPLKDPKALDPDGDGFACAWDPTPFRAALQ